MASYTVNQAAVARARRLIDARRYVLESNWGDSQPTADDENAYLESHSWDEYAEWHLGLTEGANDETKARHAFVYGDFRRVHRVGPHRLRLPGRGVAPQGGGAGRPRPPPAPRQHPGLISARGRLGPGQVPGIAGGAVRPRLASRNPGVDSSVTIASQRRTASSPSGRGETIGPNTPRA